MKALLASVAVFALTFAPVGETCASEVSPASKLKVPRVRDLPVGRVDWAYSDSALISLSDQDAEKSISSVDATFRSALQSAALVGAVHIKPPLLELPTQQPTLGPSLGVPRQFAHLQLTIEGTQYVLFVGDVAFERSRGIRHVTAALVSHSSGYARFAVHDRSGLIVGTLKTPEATYRILPLEATGQLVYRLDGGASRRATSTIRSALPVSAEIRALEMRHLAAEILADIQPWHVNFSPNDFMLTLVGGDIGTMDPDSVESEDIRNLLMRLSPLTRARGDETFRITSVTPRDESGQHTRAIRFQQTLNGIPVDFDQEIEVGADGHIERLIVGLLDPASVPKQTLLGENPAFELGVRAVERSISPLVGAPTKVGRGELRYKILDEGLNVAPVWQFIIDAAEQGAYLMEINAFSGQAQSWSADRRYSGDDFRHFVYGTISGSPVQGSDPGTSLIWSEDNEAVSECVASASVCAQPKYEMPARIIGQLNFEWEESRGSNNGLCCGGVGTPANQQYPTWTDRILDVVIDTPYATNAGPLYRQATQSVLFPPGPPEYSRSVDLVVHEVMHAYVHRYNRSFASNPHDNSRALNEGMADAMAGLFSEMKKGLQWLKPQPGTSGPDAIGEPWVIGDSPVAPMPPFHRRDLTESVTWSVFENETVDIHTRGQVIGHFYYRLWSKNAVTNNRRLMEFMLQVSKSIRDPAGDGYDLSDFYNALIDSVKPGESTLIAAINGTRCLLLRQADPFRCHPRSSQACHTVA